VVVVGGVVVVVVVVVVVPVVVLRAVLGPEHVDVSIEAMTRRRPH